MAATRALWELALWGLERRAEQVVPLLDGLPDRPRNFDAIGLTGRIGPAAAPILPRLRGTLTTKQAELNTRNERNSAAVRDAGITGTLVHAAATRGPGKAVAADLSVERPPFPR
ncbi:hypothetical protein ACH4OX_17740 [Streptomyces roseolus]|uniref:hypothetical protein n=1 Tax=Streptomyces roseolus TaxID=67358 RepID=UPI0037B2897A